MRYALISIAALALGLGGSFLVACGDRNDLFPQTSADAMNAALDRVAVAVADGDCEQALEAVGTARSEADALPADVDDELVSTLRAGLANLSSRAAIECRETETQTTQTETLTTETETETTEVPTETATQPTETEPPEPPEPPEPEPEPPTGGVTPGGDNGGDD